MGRFFVDRPIFAVVISIILTILGGIAYTQLPVEQYPEIAPPSIVVSAQYPGADAATVAATHRALVSIMSSTTPMSHETAIDVSTMWAKMASEFSVEYERPARRMVMRCVVLGTHGPSTTMALE